MYTYRTSRGGVVRGASHQRRVRSRENSDTSFIDDGRNDRTIPYHEYGKSTSSRQPSSRPSPHRSRRRSRSKESLTEEMLIKKAIPLTERAVVIEHTFSDFPFPESIHSNLAVKGYVTPSPIQDKAIMPILEGNDVVGLAATGTGKTAAFLLPLLTRIVEDPSRRALIVAPTRELALQIADEFNSFSLKTFIYAAVCVGGMPIHHQIKDLRRTHNIIIGTPGRIKDLAERGHIIYSSFNTIVLDEVDHMLDMGFVDEITDILSSLPADRQSLFFSATMPDRIRNLVETYTRKPVVIEISSGRTTDNVEQDVIKVSSRQEKMSRLHELLLDSESEKVLIFTETKLESDSVAEELHRLGHRVLAIHGDKHQRERLRALRSFKTDKIDILVATDVAARGLDIPNVSHVVNFTVPRTHEDYVHRIGRTGRASALGTALTFIDDTSFPVKKSSPRRYRGNSSQSSSSRSRSTYRKPSYSSPSRRRSNQPTQ